MKSFEHYKKQFDRATERAFMDREIKELSSPEHLKTIFWRGEGKFSRLVAALALIARATPEKYAPKYHYRTESLPFKPEEYEFKEEVLGRGGENDVYLLEARAADRPSWALKINHRDRGETDKILNKAKEIKTEYLMIRDWYRNMPELVPEEQMLILESPRDGRPVIATLQEYRGRSLRDIFKGMKQEELAGLLKADPRLKAELADFVAITREKLVVAGEMVDLLGPRNLSLVKTDEGERLLLLDPHLISKPHRDKTEVKAGQEQALAYLEAVLTEAEGERAA